MPIYNLKNYTLAIVLASGFTAIAGPIDDAKSLYNDSLYEEAVEKLEPIVSRTPRDGTANYYLGASLYELQRYEEAVPYLKVAVGRNVTDASRLLALCSLNLYLADEAATHLDAWESALKKSKKPIPDNFEQLSKQVLNMRNMLERVERIEIVDSLAVDSAEFFKAYRISESAGRILPPDAIRRIGVGDPSAELSLAYAPQTNTEIIWAQTDTAGVFQLFGASILDDGTIESPHELGDNLGEGGNALFPFLMPDGATLYFANNGENSIGGYDIFMTRRTEDGEYFQPQNMGMPYNSTANDYMLVIDEDSGLGWFATDRNAQAGEVTIYVFKPANIRVNVEPDDENLGALARLSDISLTRKSDVDYKAYLSQHLPAEPEIADPAKQQRFNLDLGNGKVYTRLADFKNEAAKSAMLELLACEADQRRLMNQVEKLRKEYRAGNSSVASTINEVEAALNKSYKQFQSLRNKVIRLEK